MKTWTCNLAIYRASKSARAARPSRPAPRAPRPAPVRWYGGRDPHRDFIACAGFMARMIVAALFVYFIATRLGFHHS